MNERETVILLVRHGETAWNRENRYQGQQDSELNERGRQQARLLAAHLESLPIAAVYASDLVRAAETARTIAAPHGLAVQTTAELRERNFGELEGLLAAEARERFAEWFEVWRESGRVLPPPGGESTPEVSARAVAWLERTVAAYPGGTVVAVAHGGPIRLMVCHVIGAPTERRGGIVLDNAGVTTLAGAPDGLRLLSLNDVGHLHPEAPVPALAARLETEEV